MRDVTITLDDVALPGIVQVPDGAGGIVVFAHGSGSSRLSPRNAAVATRLNQNGLGTLLFDLLTGPESADRDNVFDIDLLAVRLGATCSWVSNQLELAELPIGLFGASTGAAAALVAAAKQRDRVAAVVSRGGRPDLAGEALGSVQAPSLLIVGGADHLVLDLNRAALERMTGNHELVVVPGAGHLFEGTGELEEVASLAATWFTRWLTPSGRAEPGP